MTTPDFSGVTTDKPTSVLDNIGELVATLRLQSADIAKRTKELEDATAVYNRLVQVDIPAAMEEAQLTELKLVDKAVLKIKDDVNVAVNQANKPAAFAWLRENQLGSIIKSDMIIDTRALDEHQSKRLDELCVALGIETTFNESVHAQTLKSTVKDMLANGVTLPPSISVHQYKKAELKEPKK